MPAPYTRDQVQQALYQMVLDRYEQGQHGEHGWDDATHDDVGKIVDLSHQVEAADDDEFQQLLAEIIGPDQPVRMSLDVGGEDERARRAVAVADLLTEQALAAGRVVTEDVRQRIAEVLEGNARGRR